MIFFIRSRGFRTHVILPLFSANQPIALFSITSTDLYEFTSEDYDVYRALTGQMSTVLQNRRLLEQTEVALDETRRLYAASRSVATAADSAAVYQTAAIHLATASTNVGLVSMLLAQPSPSKDAPYLQYAHVWSRTQADVQVGDQISREVLSFPDMLRDGIALVNNTRTVENEALQTLLQQNGSLSAVLVAIETRLHWYGLIVCESPQPKRFQRQLPQLYARPRRPGGDCARKPAFLPGSAVAGAARPRPRRSRSACQPDEP